jgi:streptogrisin C
MRRGLGRVIGIVSCCALVMVGLTGSAAEAAAPLDRSAAIERIAGAGDLVRQRLGDSFAGYWLDDSTGRLTVGVTDPRKADVVRAAGAAPAVVQRSSAALDAAMARLDAQAAAVPPSVTGWYVDVTTNSIVVSVLQEDAAAIAFAVAAGDGLRIERVSEAPRPLWSIIGGQAISGGSARCSAGFSARSAALVRYVITAGHCTNLGGTWSGSGGVLGTVSGTSYPTNDFGVIRVTSASATSTALVDRYTSGGDVNVKGSIPAAVGAQVCRSGSTTGWRCGTVQALNQTVNYGGGNVVSGLTRTNACAEPGDSGGAFVSNPVLSIVQAQGVTSGGSGNCTTGGTTYFQPVNEILSYFHLTLVILL